VQGARRSLSNVLNVIKMHEYIDSRHAICCHRLLSSFLGPIMCVRECACVVVYCCYVISAMYNNRWFTTISDLPAYNANNTVSLYGLQSELISRRHYYTVLCVLGHDYFCCWTLLLVLLTRQASEAGMQ